MDWPHYKPHITVVDVLESGACWDGVKAWVLTHGGQIAGETQTEVANGYIARAANADGYDYGGDGCGDGGDGYGYGGDGCGDGGYGYGYGGDDYGDGGYGYGYGGDDYGDGGDDYGDYGDGGDDYGDYDYGDYDYGYGDGDGDGYYGGSVEA